MTADEREEMLRWLFSLENTGIKMGLERIRELMRRLGNPQDAYRTIHVTGTNGKGSVCTQIAAAIQAQGYRTGLYTSPHLVEFEERVKVDGVQMSQADTVELLWEVRNAASDMLSEPRQLTFFELTTAMAFLYFMRKGVDVAVIEVGLGGRLDATNVIVPLVSVITHIELEHTMYLGNTLSSIAFEKGGIIKRGVPVVTHERKEEPLAVIRGIAGERDAQLICDDELATVRIVENSWGRLVVEIEGERDYCNVNSSLWGNYQAENIETSVTAMETLTKRGLFLTENDIAAGIERAFLPGRMQCSARDRGVLFDVAHNPDAVRALSTALKAVSNERFAVVLGVLSDKNLTGIIQNLREVASVIICSEPRTPRARKAQQIRVEAEKLGIEAIEAGSVEEAMGIAESRGEGKIITGSFRTVAEGMMWWNANRGEMLWRAEN